MEKCKNCGDEIVNKDHIFRCMNKRFTCEICRQKFYKKLDYEKHRQSHNSLQTLQMLDMRKETKWSADSTSTDSLSRNSSRTLQMQAMQKETFREFFSGNSSQTLQMQDMQKEAELDNTYKWSAKSTFTESFSSLNDTSQKPHQISLSDFLNQTLDSSENILDLSRRRNDKSLNLSSSLIQKDKDSPNWSLYSNGFFNRTLENNEKEVQSRSPQPQKLQSINEEPAVIEKKIISESEVCDESEQKFECKPCDKVFASETKLNIHLSIARPHMIENGFKCKICPRVYTVKRSLLVHEKTHTEDLRKFKCDICEAKFNLQYHLDIHRRRHTGERPYKCQDCGKAFIQKSDLNRHAYRHQEIKPHKCPVCEKMYAERSKMRLHIYYRHKDIEQEKLYLGQLSDSFIENF